MVGAIPRLKHSEDLNSPHKNRSLYSICNSTFLQDILHEIKMKLLASQSKNGRSAPLLTREWGHLHPIFAVFRIHPHRDIQGECALHDGNNFPTRLLDEGFVHAKNQLVMHL